LYNTLLEGINLSLHDPLCNTTTWQIGSP